MPAVTVAVMVTVADAPAGDRREGHRPVVARAAAHAAAGGDAGRERRRPPAADRPASPRRRVGRQCCSTVSV